MDHVTYILIMFRCVSLALLSLHADFFSKVPLLPCTRLSFSSYISIPRRDAVQSPNPWTILTSKCRLAQNGMRVCLTLNQVMAECSTSLKTMRRMKWSHGNRSGGLYFIVVVVYVVSVSLHLIGGF
jgi:hypothetical protein